MPSWTFSDQPSNFKSNGSKRLFKNSSAVTNAINIFLEKAIALSTSLFFLILSSSYLISSILEPNEKCFEIGIPLLFNLSNSYNNFFFSSKMSSNEGASGSL